MSRYIIRDHKSLPEMVEEINNGVLSAQPESAAAQYAVDSVLSYNGYVAPIGLESELVDHLDILRDAGADFDYEAAVSIAKTLYVEKMKLILNSSKYILENIEHKVVFNQNDVCVILATFETPFGEVEFTIGYWLYDDGPVIKDVFLKHDGTDGERFAAIPYIDRKWLEIAAALSIDRADVEKILKEKK